jgi:hypothetical protein
MPAATIFPTRSTRRALAALLACAPLVSAETTDPAAVSGPGEFEPVEKVAPGIVTPANLGERWENLGLVFRDDDSSFIQEFWFLGRFHDQYHWSRGSAGRDDGNEIRRLRYGGQMRLMDKLSLHAQAVAGSDADPIYNGFTELWAMWTFCEEISLAVGQQKHRFTHDRNVSSRYINYLERAMLTNMFALDYTPAVTLQGRVGGVNYYTGLFSNATGGNMGRAFTTLDSGWSYLGAAYCDLGKSLGTNTAHFHATFLHSEANDNATNMNRYRHGLSSALILTEGATSLVAEVTAGLDSDLGNAIGFNIQPAFFVTDNLQLAFRYQIAGASVADGLLPQRRYEQPAGLPRGDLYQAAYFGVNYHIAKHRLKLLTGIEYATMGGEDVWTASAMVRFFFGPHSNGPFPMNLMLRGHFSDL